MFSFVKFGGSVITDKTRPDTPNLPTIRRLAADLRTAQRANPDLRIILGHGGGSFGHAAAERYGVHHGISGAQGWMGFAHTAAAVQRLSRIIGDELLLAGVPAFVIQPSATLLSTRRQIVAWDTQTVCAALDRGLLPVVHGDVAFDTEQQCAVISTEQLLCALLATAMPQPARIILGGESGIYTADPRANPQAQRIPRIDAQNIAAVLQLAGASHGADVTGGMRGKVELMWRLATAHPGISIQLIGTAPGLLTRALQGAAADEGTLITSGAPA
jgi:isopentenyl phosphate kinase